jgi:hypothetical protein
MTGKALWTSDQVDSFVQYIVEENGYPTPLPSIVDWSECQETTCHGQDVSSSQTDDNTCLICGEDITPFTEEDDEEEDSCLVTKVECIGPGHDIEITQALCTIAYSDDEAEDLASAIGQALKVSREDFAISLSVEVS